ncbi:hypothetical protein, partial [Kingella oralis]|uniref:hypothetical protein n=1 Tax=Kingella oralis TaxID=505 RepID=UPI003C702AFF
MNTGNAITRQPETANAKGMTTACCQRQPETFNTITNLKPLQTQVDTISPIRPQALLEPDIR